MILKLQEMGLNVMPLLPYSKNPMAKWERLKTEKYNDEFPEKCNLAVICGQISGNIFVLDLDDNSLFEDFKEYHGKTFTVKTGRRGYHLYFRTNGFLPNNKKMDDNRGRHIDCKAEGGYVLAPSSIHPDTKREYVILYDVPIMTINPQELKDKLISLGFNAQGKSVEDIAKGVSEGGRNDATFKYACYLMREKQLYGEPLKKELEELNKRHTPPLSNTELDTIVKQAEKYESKSIKPSPIIEEPVDTKPLKVTMQKIDPDLHENKLVEFDARVMAVGQFESYTKECTYQCSKCEKMEFEVCDDYHTIDEPFCPKHRIKMKPVMSTKKTAYIQAMRIQEFFEDALNNSPREYDAEILDKNVGKVFMNDRLHIIARLKSLPPKTKGGYNNIVFEIISFNHLDQDELCMPTAEEVNKWKSHPCIFKYVVDSIAPEIYVEDEIIQSLMLSMTGGMSLNGKRALIHCGIIGDAQLGKSELMEFMHKIMLGSGLTVGNQCSGPGLTIGMHTMYNGVRVPMAGFLPSHTGKPVFIDEADKMKREDLDYILQCMEQQIATTTKTGAGAGITYPAVCPVIVAGNPVKGKFNTKIPIIDNFNFSTPFLSRLDILWLMIDQNDPEHDEKVRQHIREFDQTKYMSITELQRFFAYVKTIQVTLPKELEPKIDELHKKMRKLNRNDGIPIGWRQFYGLNRLVTACAALHLRNTVTEEDFDIVENIIRKSLLSLKMDMETGEVQESFNKKNVNKKTILNEVWTECCDEDHTVDKDEFLTALAKRTPLFTPSSVDAEWRALEKGGSVTLDMYGRWRMNR